VAKKAATTGAGSGAGAPGPRQSFQDWARVPGPAKQHKNLRTGEVLSDRQYRQRFLYQGKTLETVQAARGQPREAYGRLLRARRDTLEAHGIRANLNDVRTSDAMKSIVRDLKRTQREAGRLTKGGRHLSLADRRRLFGPNSPAARALVDLGYRDPNAKHWVGDS
jgi:hypothetical protein